MANAPPHSDQDGAAVLAANRAFYRAFATGAFDAMAAMWADGPDVACLHPGWDLVEGRRAVLASWRRLFDAGLTPVKCSAERLFFYGDTAFVVCRETVERAVLIATNVYVRAAGAWQIVHHHAALIAVAEPEAGHEPSGPGPGTRVH